MPTSHELPIPFVCDALRRSNGLSVLDVGIGSGRWGFLAREFMDYWKGRALKKRWKVEIHGVEIFEPYINDAVLAIYDVVHCCDIWSFSEKMAHRDVVIAGDVMEHFERPTADQLILRLIQKTRKLFVLNIPLGTKAEWSQGESYGNKHETHKSFWTDEEICSLICGIGPMEKRIFKDFKGRDYGSYLIWLDGRKI